MYVTCQWEVVVVVVVDDDIPKFLIADRISKA
jgi:hypothetical protein